MMASHGNLIDQQSAVATPPVQDRWDPPIQAPQSSQRKIPPTHTVLTYHLCSEKPTESVSTALQPGTTVQLAQPVPQTGDQYAICRATSSLLPESHGARPSKCLRSKSMLIHTAGSEGETFSKMKWPLAMLENTTEYIEHWGSANLRCERA